MDDILFTGLTDEDHLQNLGEILNRLEQAGLRAKLPKCKFMAESVIYNGHQVDKEGIRPTAEKMQAVLEAPQPQNKAELRSYLGLISYYGRLIANLSSILTPLNDLLKKGVVWRQMHSGNPRRR